MDTTSRVSDAVSALPFTTEYAACISRVGDLLEVCKSDPIGFRNKNIHFGSDRIDKVVSYSRIGSDFDIRNKMN